MWSIALVLVLGAVITPGCGSGRALPATDGGAADGGATGGGGSCTAGGTGGTGGEPPLGAPFQTIEYVSATGPVPYASVTAIAAMAGGDVVVGGVFAGELDVDPGPGVDLRGVGASGSIGGAFVSRLRADGVVRWTRSFTVAGSLVRSVAGDASGAVIVSGALDGAVDPDDCEAPQTGQPPNVIKFSPEGKRLWSWTLGGAAGADARVTVAPDQKVVVYGTFAEPLDFDPGPAADIRTPNQSDGFIVELDGNGRMVRPAWTFDGPINRVQIGADGTWYVAGMFLDGDDIDPGPGELRPTLPVSTFGGYILALNADGQLRWVGSYPQSVTITQLAIGADGIFVTGGFPGEADLDPGPGEDRRRAVDGTIASFWGRFLGALDLDGKHKWVRTWGASSSDGLGSGEVVLLADGSLVVCGDFLGTLVVDGQRFWQNPDSSIGSVFLIAFEPMGVTRWIRAFPEEGNSASCSGGFARALDDTLLVAGTATGPVTVPFSGTIDTPPGVSGYVARLSLPP